MWFIENAERWVSEQDDLKAIGVEYQIDKEVEAQGFLRLFLTVTETSKLSGIPGEILPLQLVAVYPPLYPFFRPEVYSKDLRLVRHQNIVEGNLCLLPRSTSNWLPETTLASLLAEQLPKVLSEGQIEDPEVLKKKANEQAEPVSEYYPHIGQASILFDSSAFDSMPENNQKIELLGYIDLGVPLGAEVPTRMVVLESFDKEHQFLSSLPEDVRVEFPPRAKGSVYRLSERPPNANASTDYQWVNKLLEESKIKVSKPPQLTLKNGSLIENVLALTFPEEHRPGVFSWGWLFIVCYTFKSPVKKGSKPQPFTRGQYYAKINRVGNDEYGIRIPSLRLLSNETIAVFGLGALGAPTVLEFAKNGVSKLKIIDFDVVNAGSTVRWVMGISSVGMRKTDALENFISRNYPHVDVVKYDAKIGSSPIGSDGISSSNVTNFPDTDEILKDVTMIFDATAEIGVSHYLAEESRKRNIPFICVFGTQGVWGGTVLRYIPGITEGCWMCFQYHLRDGAIPNPPVDVNGEIQAAGCGDVSFTGTSFELANIVHAGVRFAVMTICSEDYGDAESDIGVLSLVDDHGLPIFPKWSAYKLMKHPDCPYCNLKSIDDADSMD